MKEADKKDLGTTTVQSVCYPTFTNCLTLETYHQRKYRLPLHMPFVEYAKTFDSIKRQALFDALKKYGVKINNIIKRNEHRKEDLSHYSQISEIEKGVRQGATLPPVLIIVA
ncbi:Uncharacterised protein at_DN1060, partial [Pycnogonum litorale]